MMTSIRRAALAAFVLALAFSGALQAVGEGRIVGTVVDEAGAPVEGAKVTLTRPGAGYKLEKVSDKKGQFMLLILDATQEYQLSIEKAGYGPYDGTGQAQAGGHGPPDLHPAEERPGGGRRRRAQGAVRRRPGDPGLQRGGHLSAGRRHGGSGGEAREGGVAQPQLAGASDRARRGLSRPEALRRGPGRRRPLPGPQAGRCRGAAGALRRPQAGGDGDKAREALDALAAADAKNPETAVRLFNEGAERARTGKLEEATTYFERVVEIAPTIPSSPRPTTSWASPTPRRTARRRRPRSSSRPSSSWPPTIPTPRRPRRCWRT